MVEFCVSEGGTFEGGVFEGRAFARKQFRTGKCSSFSFPVDTRCVLLALILRNRGVRFVCDFTSLASSFCFTIF